MASKDFIFDVKILEGLTKEKKEIIIAACLEHVNKVIDEGNEKLSRVSADANEKLKKAMQSNIVVTPHVMVRQLDTNVKIPIYYPMRTTAKTYLKEVVAYLKKQQIPDSDYLDVLPTILNRETKAWFDHIKTSTLSFKDFCTLFIAKYDTWQHQEARLNNLVTKVQRDDEPVETFVWDVLALCKQVFELSNTEEHVRRIRSALHPNLRLAIGELSKFTPEALLERCSLVINDIRGRDKILGWKTKLPPMNMHEKQQKEKEDKSNQNSSQDSQHANRGNHSRQHYQNNSSRGRGNHYGRNSYRSNGNYNRNSNYHQNQWKSNEGRQNSDNGQRQEPSSNARVYNSSSYGNQGEHSRQGNNEPREGNHFNNSTSG